MYDIKTYKCNDCPHKWMGSDPKTCPSCQSRNFEVLNIKKKLPSSRSLAVSIFFIFITIVIITFNKRDASTTQRGPSVLESETIKKNNHAFAYKIKTEKAHLHLTSWVKKTERYLVEGDECLCGESKTLNNNDGDEPFLFCWFKHSRTGTITVGYLPFLKMNFKAKVKGRERYFSLSNLYSANEKVFFHTPQAFKKTKFSFQENEFTICDEKIIKFQNEDYQYCGFNNAPTEVNSGYIKTSDLKSYY